MEIDTLLEAFQDFEKKNKKEICPVLEQFLCHVAKTGLPMIPWSQFKEYFMFKLEKVMNDFHASSPEQRGQQNPNVDYVPFEEMKERILKIVDSYNGIPFTIQRLCELLTDPKRNYTGAEKFLMGLEKNVMVVSCVYPTSEKNGSSSINRMNGVMFPGSSSLYSDCRNVNRPGTLKLNRPKLSSCHLLSTNGLLDCPVGKGPEEVEEHHLSDSSPSEGEITPNTGRKNKHPEEEDVEEEEKGHSDGDIHEVKRLKFDKNEKDERESEGKDSSCKSSVSSSETADSSKEYEPGKSCDTPTAFGDHDSSKTQVEPSEREDDTSESADDHGLETASTEDPAEKPAPSERSPSVEQESSSSDGVCLPSDEQVLSSSNSSDMSTEGGSDSSDSAKTAIEPGED